MEYAKVFNNYYGSSEDVVFKKLDNGQNVIFDIDWQGTEQIKQKKLKYKIITIFILPPSRKELFNRLLNRDLNDEKNAMERMKQFDKDVVHWKNYDLVVINDDILNYNQDIFYNKKIIIFGNLPYNISTKILTAWIKINNLNNFCKRFVLMFQKEVADRILADSNSKNYGRLSIISSWKMDIEKITDINPSSFFPSPKIKSSLLIFKPKNNYYELNNPKNLEHVTNIFFNQRRKMIKKPLKFLFKNYEKVAEELSLDLNLRPQNLTNLTYYKICSYYEQLLK